MIVELFLYLCVLCAEEHNTEHVALSVALIICDFILGVTIIDRT